MKKHLFLPFMLAAGMMAMVASCDKPGNNPDPDPNPDPDTDGTELAMNTIRINGEDTQIGSCIATSLDDDYIVFAVSPTAGYTDIYDLLSYNDEGVPENDFLYLALYPTIVNQEVDFVSEQRTFTLMCSLPGATIEAVVAGETDEISEGKGSITVADGKAVLKVAVTLADGTKLEVLAETAFEEAELNSNTITYNDLERPVRTAFYSSDYPGMVLLYFSPADIESFEEIYDVFFYGALMIYDEEADGTVHDIAGSDGQFFLSDNSTGTSYTLAKSGTFSVKKNSATNYTVTADLVLETEPYDDEPVETATMTISFEGECIDVNYVPEKGNEMTVDDETISLLSAVVDKSGGYMWKVALSPREGVTTVADAESDGIIFSVPGECFDGEPRGFSQYQDMEVRYQDYLWNYYDYSGTVTASIMDDNLYIEFTNYENCELYYNGTCTIVE